LLSSGPPAAPEEATVPEPRQDIDFYTFVLSIGSSVLVHLGDAPHPETGTPGERNLPLAHQSIEILAMLQEKTRGNLSEEEDKLLVQLLLDLKLRYVEASKRT
jgi:hypothetical protein